MKRKGRLEIKICGLTTIDDALAALQYGADYIGFVLYEKSPRSVAPAELLEITRNLPEHTRTIGVFVNESRSNVIRIAMDCGLHAVQIHGDEWPADFEHMVLPVWRAVRIIKGMAQPDPGLWNSARYVLDSAVPGMYGGSGVQADWDLAGELARGFPVMLAGGLNAGNVAEAVETVMPLGVDVASGVETSPGKKDHEAMRDFIEQARIAEESFYSHG